MASLQTGSWTKSSSLPSILLAAKLSSPSSGVKFIRCEKWTNAREQLAKPMMISQRSLLTRHRAGFSAHSQNISENYLTPEYRQSEPSKCLLKTFQEKMNAFKQVTRPELLVAKMWSIISASLLAVQNFSDLSPAFFVGLSQVVVAVMLMVIYVIGLNQITDIEIDKVNKPNRPLITGEHSMLTIATIVSSSAIMSFLIGWITGSWTLLCTLFTGFAIGTIYSVDVPFLRWKRIPLGATFCMLCLQIVWPIGIYLHTQTSMLGQSALPSTALIAITVFLSVFAVAQTLLKDIPDIEGDRLDGNQTLPVRFGAEKVFWGCIGIFQFAYLIVILAGLTYPSNWRKFMIVASHMVSAFIAWSRAKSVDLKNQAEIWSFYGFTWKLVSAEYLLIHLLK